MAEAAEELLSALDEERRAAIVFPFDDEERFWWEYRPDGHQGKGRTVWHEGLRLLDMSDAQQRAALDLLDRGLSVYGRERARGIMQLERHLRDSQHLASVARHVVHDPELYAFAIFGRPGGSEPWMWRVGGHHLGVHFTIVDGDLVAPTPLFFGANPASVRHGPDVGLRTLPEEEDQARELLRALDRERRERAVVSAVAPSDILSGTHRNVDPTIPARGLPLSAMIGDERERLLRLVQLYVNRTDDEIARAAWLRIEAAGLETITFAWAGSDTPGEGHYYSVRGPTFLIEYDNTQNGANHIHSVWRDVTGDWGEDLLAAHYAHAHAGHG